MDARGTKQRALGAALCLTVIAASVLYAPWATTGPVVCPLRLCTGLPCPGCGLTRAFCAMAQGRILDAFGYHVFGPLLFAACLAAIPILGTEAVAGRRFVTGWRCRLAAPAMALLLITFHGWRLAALFSSGQVITLLRTSLLGSVFHL